MTNRRDFLRLLGVGGAVFASACVGGGGAVRRPEDDFYFVQLSDTHWGYKGPANPEAANTLREAVAAVNALPRDPDFIVFTGDLTHTTDDAQERRRRMAEFKEIISGLRVQRRVFMPGEHDASLDAGAAFVEAFGPTHWSFDHKGLHFVALDNVSDPQAAIGAEQLDWLAKDIKAHQNVVVFTHRPLFDLAPSWDWATRDGSKAIDILQGKNATVFYGHIHQEHHYVAGGIPFHAAQSLIFPLPAPMSVPKKAPLPWDPQHKRLGWRDVREPSAGITEHAV